MTPVVLPPGMMCDARLWGPVMEDFAGRAVLSAPMTEASTTAGLAHAVLALPSPRFALCGLSMGGIVAMEMLAQARDQVERLALMDTKSAGRKDRGAGQSQRADRAGNVGWVGRRDARRDEALLSC